ncbi:hypothetical protein VPH49_25880 [Pseudomonas luteola]|uniref:hypothetical protein n=1 Tax=Pseudomonas luteola TaxID=47886 RepID=UPI003A8871A3
MNAGEKFHKIVQIGEKRRDKALQSIDPNREAIDEVISSRRDAFDDLIKYLEKDLGDKPMNDITREELDAKLATVEARVDARLASFESTIRETMGAIRQDSAEIRGEIKALHSELGNLKNIKQSIWGAAGSTFIAVVGVVGAMLAYGVSSYDSGRDTSELIAEAKQQTKEAQALLKEIQAHQKHSNSPPPTDSQSQPVSPQ